MKIVLKWIFRMLFADIPRLLLTVLSIAGAFTMLTAMGLTTESHMLSIGSMNSGMPKLVVSFLRPIVFTVLALTLYVLFSVSLEERRNQYRIMRTAGATTRQLLRGLVTEALALDAVGALIGIALGFLAAFFLLKASGLPLSPQTFMLPSVQLQSILPAFLMPPVIMLISSPRLFLPGRTKHRAKPPKTAKNPFQKRLLPRLFGTGGKLEYALGRRQRRHRALLVTAVVANMAALFMVTAGISVLANLEPANNEDLILYFSHSPWNDEELGTNGVEMKRSMDDLLQKYKNDGLLQEYKRVSHCHTHYFIAENKNISDEILNVERSRPGDPFSHTYYSCFYRLSGNRQLIEVDIVFLDDPLFHSFMKKIGVSASGTGGVFVNSVYYYDGTGFTDVPVFSKNAPDEIILVNVSSEASKSVPVSCMQYAANADMFDPGFDFERLFENSDRKLKVKLDDILIPDYDFSSYNYYTILGWHSIGTTNTLYLPESMHASVAEKIPLDEHVVNEFFLIDSTDTAALLQRLKTELDGKYGYTFLEQKFGDGDEFFDTDGYSLDEKYERWYKNIEVYDLQTQQNDFHVFLQNTKQLYSFFTILIFIMIGLNIVNIVHMNRLSRRREYAILTSIGLGGKQRLGMMMYESFRLTVRTVFFGTLALVIVTYFVQHSFRLSLTYENMVTSNIDYLSGRDYTSFDELLMVAKDLWLTIRPTWWLIVVAVLFVFLGFVVTELLVQRQFEKDELVLILKDDMHE